MPILVPTPTLKETYNDLQILRRAIQKVLRECPRVSRGLGCIHPDHKILMKALKKVDKK